MRTRAGGLIAEAAKWYRWTAEQGVAPAQLGLGNLYANGLGVPQDYAEAAKWYRRAAEQGAAPAQAILGLLYANGQGVPQDYVLAHMWLNLSASRLPLGEIRDDAVKGRDALAALMTPAQIAEAQRVAREWKPKPERPQGRIVPLCGPRPAQGRSGTGRVRAALGAAGWLLYLRTWITRSNPVPEEAEQDDSEN